MSGSYPLLSHTPPRLVDRPRVVEALALVDRPRVVEALALVDRPRVVEALALVDRPRVVEALALVDRPRVVEALALVDRPRVVEALALVDFVDSLKRRADEPEASQPDPPDNVRGAAPCQIRRSVPNGADASRCWTGI